MHKFYKMKQQPIYKARTTRKETKPKENSSRIINVRYYRPLSDTDNWFDVCFEYYGVKLSVYGSHPILYKSKIAKKPNQDVFATTQPTKLPTVKKINKILDEILAGEPTEDKVEIGAFVIDFNQILPSSLTNLITMLIQFRLKHIDKRWLAVFQDKLLEDMPCIDHTTPKASKKGKVKRASRGLLEQEAFQNAPEFPDSAEGFGSSGGGPSLTEYEKHLKAIISDYEEDYKKMYIRHSSGRIVALPVTPKESTETFVWAEMPPNTTTPKQPQDE